jgi:chromosome segregation ATPase
MKNFQQTLLMSVGLGLCGLCAWQWYVQTIQRTTIHDLNQMVYDRNASIQNYTNSITTLNGHVAEMDERISELKTTVATNQQVIASQTAQITQLQFAHESDTNEIAQYKTAVDTLESRLKDADANIDKQNVAITNLLSQRNDLVKKYDDLATNRNDIVLKYNELVKQVQGQGGADK